MTTSDHKDHERPRENERRNDYINDMAQVGAYLKKGGAGEEKTKQILVKYGLSLNSSIYGKNFNKLKEDINHAVIRSDIYIWHIDGKGMQEVCEEWIDHQEGPFSHRNAYTELQLTTREEKKHFRTCVYRCIEKGLVRATKKRAGEYRRIDQKLEPIEIIKHKYNEYPVMLPLDLDDWAIIRPANIIMIAGEKGSGKSAFCLNAALKNMNRSGVPIKYFSSEMRGPELTERLIAFEPDVPFKTWQESNVEFFYRRRDYMDVVDPDAFNIIDYLEISDSFYNVADLISDIFDALKDGIALIALQKDKNTELGRGASFSMEKSRLYVTLNRNPPDGNIAKIIDAKTWRKPNRNPNYRSCNFKLINGSIMQMVGGWVRSED